MSKTLFVILAVILAGYGFYSCTEPATPPEKSIAQKLLTQVDSFALICRKLQGAPPSQQQDLFLQARLAYKRIEWATEYFDPATSRIVNGAPVQEVEKSGLISDPTGLQVIETYLYPTVDSSKRTQLHHQTELLLAACEKYKSHFANIPILDWQVFDAARLEVFRVITLGITGFDNALTLHSAAESAAALQSLQPVLANYSGAPDLTPAIHYLNTHPDFNSFDRATFITGYANPLGKSILEQQSALHIHVIRYNRLLNQDAPTLFDTAAWNVNAYSPDIASFVTPAKIALGRRLFTDPTLSSTGTRSCQSCHQPEKTFTDGLVKNTVLGNTTALPRNTPTLINAALQPAQFDDMRVGTLEDQSLTVVQNQAEMHGSMKLSVIRLWADTAYRRMFTEAFPRKGRAGIDTLEVMNAIGSYVRSLVALDSRFDDYMRGNKTALTANEVNGFNLFMGKARCATCHYMPLFNGAFPPRFVKTEAEVIGVPQTVTGKILDADEGRYAVIPVASFHHAFKTPTIRNAARTAPYMHNGVFTTLEQVIDFYDKGGGVGLGLPVPNQTLPFDKLNLGPQEKSDLIAFIKSLDSKTTGGF